MRWDELEIKVKNIFASHLGIDPLSINLETDLNSDLDTDSVDPAEIILKIEKELNISLNWDQFINSDIFISFYSAREPYDKTKFYQKTFGDFIWNLGYILNYYNNPRAIESNFLALNVNNYGKIKPQINSTKTEFFNEEINTINPAGVYVPCYNKWYIIIKEFEDLINTPNLKEYELQKFLEDHPEFLIENSYDIIIPEATISTHNNDYWSADFILKPINPFNFCKIIELKKPFLRTYIKDINRHSKFSSKLYNAINQLKDYSVAFKNKETQVIFKNKYNFEVYEPDLHLIIGRKWDVADTRIILEFQRRNNMKIETWDDFLDKLKKKFT